MSEFKFACPVCGQHITADSSTSGGQLECPTCFRKIVVPQAPLSTESKFILSAAQVGKPRPTGPDLLSDSGAGERPRAKSWPVAAVLLILVCGAAAAAFVFRNKILKSGQTVSQVTTNAPKKKAAERTPIVVHPVPTNFVWTLDLTNADFPDSVAAGSIHGHGFVCDRSILQGGTLTLRQGKNGPPDLSVAIQFVAKQGEELSGKIVEIPAYRQPPVPKVTLRWKDEQLELKTQTIEQGGYAVKVAFGDAANGRMPGKIYISLPDTDKSFVAGTFEAEIRKPPPPKKGPSKGPKPKQ